MPQTPSIAPSEALPSYDTAISTSFTPESQQQIVAPDEQPRIPPFDPPAFSTSPITLSILPHSHLIDATPKGSSTFPATTRALYELTQPLDGHWPTTTIAEILPQTRLRDDGRCRVIMPKQLLYKIYQSMGPQSPRETTVISAQNTKLIQGTTLRKGLGFGHTTWEARSHGEDWIHRSSRISVEPENQNTLLYQGKKRSDGCIEWKDSAGKVVAEETCAADRETDAEKLDILVSLEKNMLDMLVAVWAGRIWQGARKDRLKEQGDEAERKKEEQKIRDMEQGKPHGKLHNIKEALGIGYGLKRGPRNGLYGGPPSIGDNGRIKWS